MIASGIGLTVGGQLLGVAYLSLWRSSYRRPRYILSFLALIIKPGYLIIHNSRSPLIFVLLSKSNTCLGVGNKLYDSNF